MTKLFFASRSIYLKLKKMHLHIIPLFFLTICKIINRIYNSGIPINNNINAFFPPHGLSGIYISKQAKLGKNCTIFQQVTIGINDIQSSKHFGAPIIGNNVYIGAGAKIIGKVKVGNNVNIGANCIVTEDIPNNSTVVMPHPRIIRRND